MHGDVEHKIKSVSTHTDTTSHSGTRHLKYILALKKNTFLIILNFVTTF